MRWKKYSAEKSAGRIRREYECFVIHIHFKTPLLARFTSLGPGPLASACFLSIPRIFPREDCFVLRVPV